MQTAGSPTQAERTSPFALANPEHYRRWREAKLAAYPQDVAELIVEVDDPMALRARETDALLARCRKANMVVYRTDAAAVAGKEIPRAMGARFGLHRLDPNMLADDDGITSLQVVAGKSTRGYIPYTNKRLLWHTDGYYNPPDRRIRAMMLHCAVPAPHGGTNRLLDHELVYILLRDENPDFVRALMAPDAMTIPANTETVTDTRPAQSGPVFSIEPSGDLHMRYTARTRSIEWKSDPLTNEAVACLESFLANDSPHIFEITLAGGEGLLCNNVLHSRTEFDDDPASPSRRLVYRARYYDRIAGTNVNEIYE